MKCLLLLWFVLPAATAQTTTSTIAGKVLDAKNQKPVPAAWVMTVRSGLPPFSRSTKSGADGAFRIQGLPAGKYSLCVQAGDAYLDPCQWNAAPTIVTLVSGQVATAVTVKLSAASVLNIQVQDAQKVLRQTTKDGRRPELTVGVWGPKGLYYPARISRRPAATAKLADGMDTYGYQIAVPRDTALKLYVASRDLKLGDTAGAALAGNASQQSFQHITGDANPKSFAFTVLGLLP